jgi:hypothetical protein
MANMLLDVENARWMRQSINPSVRTFLRFLNLALARNAIPSGIEAKLIEEAQGHLLVLLRHAFGAGPLASGQQ